MTSAIPLSFRMPAEWAPHEATWVAWPSHEDLWGQDLAPVRSAFARMVAAIARGEVVHTLVPDGAQEAMAREALPVDRVVFHRVPFGDIWLRDTAPLFVTGGGQAATVRFRFNGWGGKYVLDHDDRVGERVAALAQAQARSAGASCGAFDQSFVLEGGAVEVDGEGSVMTTRQCMLNPNRNGAVDPATVEGWLCRALGVDKVLWLGDGLLGDHTDGHVDTLARFVRPGVVVVMEPRANDDPNAGTLRAIFRDASSLVDARGRRIEVVTIPSPGRVVDSEGRVMPASYANYYVSNASVVVPTYGSPWDDEAVEAIATFFPGRRTVGIDARALLTGGGAFHCITQQQPARAA